MVEEGKRVVGRFYQSHRGFLYMGEKHTYRMQRKTYTWKILVLTDIHSQS